MVISHILSTILPVIWVSAKLPAVLQSAIRIFRTCWGQLTGACAAEGINIEDMTNKSKGDWAYTMMDIGSEVSEALVEKLAAINGVVKKYER